VIESCSPKCDGSKICKIRFCSSDTPVLDTTRLPRCYKYCCNKCKDVIKCPPIATEYKKEVCAKLRHKLCEKPCCLGERHWVNKCTWWSNYNYKTCFILTLIVPMKMMFCNSFCTVWFYYQYFIKFSQIQDKIWQYIYNIYKHTHIKKLVIYQWELLSFWNDNLGLFSEKNCEYHCQCLAINWSSLTNNGLDTYVLLFHIITSRSTYNVH